MQEVRSFKIQVANYWIALLENEQRKKRVVSSSTGNHAQGFAKASFELKIKEIIWAKNLIILKI